MNGTRPSDLNELSLLSATVRFLGCRLVETARLCTGAAVKSREGSINNKFAHFGERHIASARFLQIGFVGLATTFAFWTTLYFILVVEDVSADGSHTTRTRASGAIATAATHGASHSECAAAHQTWQACAQHHHQVRRLPSGKASSQRHAAARPRAPSPPVPHSAQRDHRPGPRAAARGRDKEEDVTTFRLSRGYSKRGTKRCRREGGHQPTATEPQAGG